MFELFLRGGPLMWPLLLLSVLTLAVALERSLFLLKQRSSRREKERMMFLSVIAKEGLEAGTRYLNGSSDSVLRIIVEGLAHPKEQFEGAIGCAVDAELERYDRGLALLDTAVTLAPLLGLLGTVTGMIQSFGLLGASELDAPVAITGGVAEALIATAFGLTIAIVAIVPFNLVQAARERFTRKVEDAATRVELLLRAEAVGALREPRAA